MILIASIILELGVPTLRSKHWINSSPDIFLCGELLEGEDRKKEKRVRVKKKDEVKMWEQEVGEEKQERRSGRGEAEERGNMKWECTFVSLVTLAHTHPQTGI